MNVRIKPSLYVPALAVVAVAGWIRFGSIAPELLDLSRVESIQVVDRSGELLYEARANDGSRASRLSPDALPPMLVDATLAAEDHRFFGHPGLDPLAIARALVRDIRSGRVVEGGSTITQQVAKLLIARRDGPSRGFSRKLREAVLALRLEHRFGKREILALYLDLASYGNQLTGASRASRAYFDADPAALTPAQAAFLASLPQRPTAFNPYRDPERARARQRRVLARMAALGTITRAELAAAADERLAFTREPAVFVAPHFVQRVLAQVVGPERPAPSTQTSPAPRIVTTLDAGLQREVQGIIRAERRSLDRAGAHNVAVVVLDNANGEWLAWEGSGNYDDQQHGGAIDGAATPRQPGSALKPFTYALAFEEGDTPATVLPDVPSTFPTAVEGVMYRPTNYDGQYRGPMRARQALAGSENVPAVALASRLGVAALVRFYRDAGLTTFDRTASYYGLGATLGDAEVRLDELVAAYAAFARGGRIVHPTMLRDPIVASNSSSTSTREDPASRLRPLSSEAGFGAARRSGEAAEAAAGLIDQPLVTSRTAFWITDILSDPRARAYAFGRGGSLEFAFPVAAKTGTSTAYRDNWAIGYTRRVTVGVWVGNFDRTPLVNSSGVTGAGPIFHAVLLAAERRVAGELPSDGEPPTEGSAAGLARQSICALSGAPATRDCPSQVEEWLPVGGDSGPGRNAIAQAERCDWHVRTADGIVVAWPAEFRQWAGGLGLVRPVRAVADASARLRIANPPDGAIYLIDPTLRVEYQTLSFEAAGAIGRVAWRVDGREVGSAAADLPLRWPVSRGAHEVTARDAVGRAASARVRVK